MKIFIIAEAGVNHNGSITTAKKLIDAAAAAGADAVKFQSFKAENIVTASAKKATYQTKTTSTAESQLQMLKKLELSADDHTTLIQHCKKRKIIFMSTPFDLDSIDLLQKLKLQIIKIPSGEITNIPYLRKIGKLNKKIILSTGMSDLPEIDTAIKNITNYGTNLNNIILMHCNTEYPTPVSDVNLKALHTIREVFKLPVGYSDHTQGIEISLAAAALGAVVIEKHFTLDQKMQGPDHKASLTVDELKQLVKSVRNIEKALGNGKKEPSASERKNIKIVRKSITAACAIKTGEQFTDKNITTKRTGNGISAIYWDFILNKKADRDYKQDDIIKL